MKQVEEIIRKYAKSDSPVKGFGSWLVSGTDSELKDEALAGLWLDLENTPAADDVEARRDKLESLMGSISGGYSRKSSPWIRRTASVAFAAAAGLLLMFLLRVPGVEERAALPDEDLVAVSISVDDPGSGLGAAEIGQDELPVAEIDRVVRRVNNNGFLKASVPVLPVNGETSSDMVEAAESSSASDALEEDGPVTGAESVEDKDETARQWAELEREESQAHRKRGFAPSVGLRSSSGLLSAASSGSLNVVPGSMVSGNIGEGNWLGGVWGGSAGTVNGGTQTRYDIPIKAALSLSWPVGDRVSIGAGIGLTSLHSRTIGYLDGAAYKYDSRAVYAGIPLSLRYDFVSWGKSCLYGAAGVSVDYCVRAWSLPGGTKASDIIVSDEHPLQLSAGLSAGYEYLLFRNWGVFAEASLDYYFKDNSSLDTYFKAHPLSPSVSLGIHYSFDK